MNKIEGTPVSKYHMINQMLSARRLDKRKKCFTGEEVSSPGTVCEEDVCDRERRAGTDCPETGEEQMKRNS